MKEIVCSIDRPAMEIGADGTYLDYFTNTRKPAEWYDREGWRRFTRYQMADDEQKTCLKAEVAVFQIIDGKIYHEWREFKEGETFPATVEEMCIRIKP